MAAEIPNECCPWCKLPFEPSDDPYIPGPTYVHCQASVKDGRYDPQADRFHRLSCRVGYPADEIRRERRARRWEGDYEPPSILPDFDEVRLSCPQGHLLCEQLVERG
jgi:hypothetical protein